MTGNEEKRMEAAFDFQETTELLNTAYEAVAGSSTILDMLYLRLQEAYEAESTEMAGIVFVVRRSLDESVRMIGDAEEALGELKSLSRHQHLGGEGYAAGGITLLPCASATGQDTNEGMKDGEEA